VLLGLLHAGKTCEGLSALPPPSTCKPSNSSSCLPALSEAAALLSWKAQLNDTNNTLANWTGVSPCIHGRAWPGAMCSEDRMAVVAVNVSGFGLMGTLPGTLAALSSLQVRVDCKYKYYDNRQCCFVMQVCSAMHPQDAQQIHVNVLLLRALL
jgi:hypothetical protein